MKLLREVVEPQLVELRDALLERDDVVAAERLEGRLRRVDADAGRAVQVEALARVEGLLWAGALLQRRQRRRCRGREVGRGPLVRLAHVEQERVAGRDVGLDGLEVRRQRPRRARVVGRLLLTIAVVAPLFFYRYVGMLLSQSGDRTAETSSAVPTSVDRTAVGRTVGMSDGRTAGRTVGNIRKL